SLEAGHPVPAAIALVGKEMPDPIGTEFGMLADELAYGSSLNDAVRRLSMRSFNPDIDLFAATIRLQQKTGGNLSELLRLNSSAIRERQVLRLKIKAASAEGRMSAMILTFAPFIVLGIVHVMNPSFYGDIIHLRIVQYWLAGFATWIVIGNLIMRKMINFRI
ncbi:MAG: type II secretion system F family protein, partial [Pseudomonadota bacterium]